MINNDWLHSKGYDDWKLNPPELKESAFKCSCCGEPLYPEDKCWKMEGEHYCHDCAREWFDYNWRYVTEDDCVGNR